MVADEVVVRAMIKAEVAGEAKTKESHPDRRILLLKVVELARNKSIKLMKAVKVPKLKELNPVEAKRRRGTNCS